MKPAQFDYVRPRDVAEVLDVLATHGEDARVLAGGLSLVAMLNFRLVQPKVVVDISALSELSFIVARDDFVEVGAAVTQAEFMAWPELAEKLPLISTAMPHIGHFQTRARGTVCGSICHCEPSSELPLCLATLDGAVELRSKRGSRVLKAAEFQAGILSNARAADELVYAVRFPIAGPGRSAFAEVTERRGDFAIVAAAAVADGTGLRLGIGGVADRPVVKIIDGLGSGDVDDALNALAWELGGDTDIHATARYRRHLVRHLGKQVIEEVKSA